MTVIYCFETYPYPFPYTILYDNPKFNQFLEALAYCDIPKLHIFIIGRKYPSIPYLEMEIRGCAERIGIHDLCLSRSEVEDFFEINNCNIFANK